MFIFSLHMSPKSSKDFHSRRGRNRSVKSGLQTHFIITYPLHLIKNNLLILYDNIIQQVTEFEPLGSGNVKPNTFYETTVTSCINPFHLLCLLFHLSNEIISCYRNATRCFTLVSERFKVSQ